MKNLTNRQNEVLHTIYNSIAEHGIPPTLREIGSKLGIHSTNGVNDHLNALEKKGMIRRRDMQSRGIRLTNEAYIQLNYEPIQHVALAIRLPAPQPVVEDTQRGARLSCDISVETLMELKIRAIHNRKTLKEYVIELILRDAVAATFFEPQ